MNWSGWVKVKEKKQTDEKMKKGKEKKEKEGRKNSKSSYGLDKEAFKKKSLDDDMTFLFY